MWADNLTVDGAHKVLQSFDIIVVDQQSRNLPSSVASLDVSIGGTDVTVHQTTGGKFQRSGAFSLSFDGQTVSGLGFEIFLRF